MAMKSVSDGACDSYRLAEAHRGASASWQVSRRGLLATLGLGAIGWLGVNRTWAQATFGQGKESNGDVLVNVFLRGGMDGLSAVVPYGEDGYHRARPNLRLRAPQDNSAGASAKALDLDGFFGLHPALAPLLPIFRDGEMACVHAVGSGDSSRSHFEAMNAMERGMDRMQGNLQTGWLARHLATTPRMDPSPLRAVSLSATVPDSLRGASHATALDSLTSFRLENPEQREMLQALYGTGRDAMSVAGRETLAVLDRLGKLEAPKPGDRYPATEIGRAFQQVAALIRAGVGLEIACLEMGGWDTHVAQGVTAGWLPSYFADLAAAIRAFYSDMGDEMGRITLIVQTEFGRRLEENTGLGTDHGRASTMFLLGGGVVGGKVHGVWPGLEKGQLDEVGDLKVGTDYRDVLADALTKRIPGSRPAEVFPDWKSRHSGFFR